MQSLPRHDAHGPLPPFQRCPGQLQYQRCRARVRASATRPCWSDVLKANGYSLGYIGKWHLDSPHKPYVDTSNNTEEFAWNEWTPPERRHGFDFWYAYGTYDNHDHPEYWTTEAPRSQRTRVDQWGPEHEADMAIRFIRNEGEEYRDPEKPWALVVSMNPPHMPYQRVPERYLEMYGEATSEDLINRPNVRLEEETRGVQLARRHMKNYLAQVTGVDDQFGRILAALKEAGLEEDTIVVFTSDHGNCLGSPRGGEQERPLRGVHAGPLYHPVDGNSYAGPGRPPPLHPRHPPYPSGTHGA